MTQSTTGLVERIRERADRIRGYIASSQIVVDLLKPQMDMFDARQGGHDIYTVRLSVDHQSSIRTQGKELGELDEAADLLAELVAALEAIRDGDVPRPVGKHWNPDESPSKHDRCIHGFWMYDTCGNCIDAFVETALTKSRSAQHAG